MEEEEEEEEEVLIGDSSADDEGPASVLVPVSQATAGPGRSQDGEAAAGLDLCLGPFDGALGLSEPLQEDPAESSSHSSADGPPPALRSSLSGCRPRPVAACSRKRKRSPTKSKRPHVPQRPRTAFELFFAEQRDAVQAELEQERHLYTVAELRRTINANWAALSKDEVLDWQLREERERQHFARLQPDYRRLALCLPQSKMARRPRAAKSNAGRAPTGAGAKPGGSRPSDAKNASYRRKVEALHREREELARREMQELRQEEDLHSDVLGVAQALGGVPPRGPQPEETCSIPDVPQYLRSGRGRDVPLSRRILNAGRAPGEAAEVLPSGLAVLLKDHQLEGVQFLWRNIVMPPDVMPALESQATPGNTAEHTGPVRHQATKGCVLAHGMGLGKTLTSIAFALMYLRHHKGRTVLVIAPKSTLHQWRREFTRWCGAAGLVLPQVWLLDDRIKSTERRLDLLRQWVAEGGVMIMGYALFVQLTGGYTPAPASKPARPHRPPKQPRGPAKRRRGAEKSLAGDSEDDDVVYQTLARTSYACNSEDEVEERQVTLDAPLLPEVPQSGAAASTASEFQQLLQHQAPDCIIIDEGHKVSNPKSCLTRALNGVRTRERIICTGTPIQNNVWEYFAMVDFIRPGYWDCNEFRRLYATTIRSGQTSASNPQQVLKMEEASKKLYRDLAKLVHRCDVRALQRELPPLVEYVIRTPLSQVQAKVYTAFMAQSLKACDSTAQLQTKRILGLSPVLYRIGNHPDLARHHCIHKGLDPLVLHATEDSDSPADEFSFTQQDKDRTLCSKDGKDFSWARPLFVPEYPPAVLEHSTKMVALFTIIHRSMELGEKVLLP